MEEKAKAIVSFKWENFEISEIPVNCDAGCQILKVSAEAIV